MSSLLGAAFLVVGFLVLFRLLKIGEAAGASVATSRAALFDISRRDIDDEEKEKALRGRALELLKAAGWLIVAGSAAVGLPVLILWGLDEMGIGSLDGAIEVASSWEFLLFAAVLTVFALWLPGRKKRAIEKKEKEEGGFEDRYSATSRLLHHLAFATTPAQVAVADLEDRWVAKKLRAQPECDPVFITALPRAGTTLLLELCAETGEFATHTYRHMPFVFTPALWLRLTRSMRVTEEARERAHGDGMLVNEDSPEAFEEMLWGAFWQDKYHKNRIQSWEGEENEEFIGFFRRHMQKIVMLAATEADRAPTRYISKNNLNIARIAWLASAFPTARFLVAFRHPLEHAASLLRQHQNFLKIHAADPFARNYMAAIGHFDFGANLRPVNFGGWLDQENLPPATTLEFWLRYWIASYRHLGAIAENRMMLLDYNRLCEEPGAVLRRVAGFIDLQDPDLLVRQQSRLKSKPAADVEVSQVPPEVLQQARDIYRRLSNQAQGGQGASTVLPSRTGSAPSVS